MKGEQARVSLPGRWDSGTGPLASAGDKGRG